MECLNCGTDFEGHYCPNCGQKVFTTRFTTKRFITEFLETMTNLERGLWFTIIEMLKHPHVVINNYVNGKTRQYINPLRFIILVSAVVTLIASQFDLFGAIYSQPALNTGDQSQEFVLKVQEIMTNYFNLIIIFSVPCIAIFSWLFYRKAKWSFGEHLILSTFIVSERQLLYAFIIPFQAMVPSLYWELSMPAIILGTIYYGWAAKNLFNLSLWKTIWSSTLITILSMVVFTFIGLIIAVVAVAIIFINR